MRPMAPGLVRKSTVMGMKPLSVMYGSLTAVAKTTESPICEVIAPEAKRAILPVRKVTVVLSLRVAVEEVSMVVEENLDS